MEFQLWVLTNSESKCFAKRTQEETRPEYHDMKVGEWRPLSIPGHEIIRSK